MSDERIRDLFPGRIGDGSAVIEVVEGPDSGARTRIAPGQEIRVGRDSSCELRLTDPSSALTHLRIRSNGREVVLFDTSGGAGTYLRDESIEYRILCAGDKFRIGANRIEVFAAPANLSPDPESTRDASRPQNASASADPATCDDSTEVPASRERKRVPLAKTSGSPANLSGSVRSAMGIARLLIRRGIASPEKIESLLARWESLNAQGRAVTFGKWLVEEGAVTREEILSLRDSLEPRTAPPATAEPPRTGGEPKLPVFDPKRIDTLPISPGLLPHDLRERAGTGSSPIALGRLLATAESFPRHVAERLKNLRYDLEGIGTIEGYQYLQLIGAGSAGFVFEAQSARTGEVIALKIIRPELLSRQSVIRRFQRESKIMLSLAHPNLVRGIDIGYSNGLHYLVMEHVPGESLKERIDRDGALPERAALALLRDSAQGLSAAEEKGILHRDIKPANILITASGQAKLCDLGLAKIVGSSSASSLTATGFVVGTPDYMSPEQAQGLAELDVRADVYALGASFYHALTGLAPFAHESPLEVMLMHIHQLPVPPRERRPDLSAGASILIERMLAKAPRDRHSGTRELLEAIALLL